MITITFITNDNKTVQAPDNSNLLRVSLREKGGIPFKCGGGICGTCRCRIEAGQEHADKVKAKERKHLTDADLAAGYRMACQTFVNGDVSVSWVPMEDRKRPVPAQPASSRSTSGAGEALVGREGSSTDGTVDSPRHDEAPVGADAG
jgi:ferredoxin